MKNIVFTFAFILLGCLGARSTVLTFDGPFSNYGLISQDYGDNVTNTTMGAYSYGESGEGFTPDVLVEYIGVGNGVYFWDSGFGDLVNVVENEDDYERYTSIRFEAAYGAEIVLHSMDLGSYESGPLVIDNIFITNESGVVLFQTNNFTLAGSGSGHTNVNFGAVSGRRLTLVLDLQTAAAGSLNDSIGLDNITFSQTGTALFPDAVAVDGDVPAVLGIDGTESEPDIYIIGAINAYTRDYDATPLILGWNGSTGGSYGSDGRSYVQLYIQNGSTVMSGDGSCVGQYYNHSHRLVRLTDAFSWIVDGKLSVPSSGNADRLEVFGGSLVTVTNLTVAGGSYCTGSVTVSNVNSRVISTGDLGGGTAAGAGSSIYLEDHGLVRIDGANAYVDVVCFNEGFFAWAGDHTGNSRPFFEYYVWSGTNWQDQATGLIQFTETYYATDAEAKLATADPEVGFEGYDRLGGYTIWTSYIEVPIITNTLAVISEYGSPLPVVGTNLYASGTVVSGYVNSVTSGLTNYSASGWSLSGGPLLAGVGASFEFTITNDVVLTWNWQTNYWLDVATVGGGTVGVPIDQFRPKGSMQSLTATPAVGWLFIGWSGDASGTNQSIDVTMDSPKAITATFSDDADGDGLTNTEEAAAGSNPWKSDTDEDGFDDAFEVAQGLNVTNDSSAVVNYIGSHGDSFGLYPSNVVFDIATGQMLLEPYQGNAILWLQLEQSEDLVSWTNAGEAVEWVWPVDGDKKYFRVRSTGEQE